MNPMMPSVIITGNSLEILLENKYIIINTIARLTAA